jgi:cytochrome P450
MAELPIRAFRYFAQDNFADALRRVHDEFGDVVWFPKRRFVLVCDAAMVEHVLVNNARNYGKSQAMQMAKILLGDGLLTNEGDSWRSQRRLMQPAFHRRQIGQLAGTMTDCVETMLEGWHKGGVLNVSAELSTLTLTIVARALFGSSISDNEAQQVSTALDFMLRLFQQRAILPFSFLNRLPLPSNRSAEIQINHLNQIIYRIIAARRRSDQLGDDLLGMLMAAQDEETGSGMSDQQLRDEAMTLFLAGHETTASHLTWTLWLLDKHPAVLAQLMDEIRSVVGRHTPTLADVGQLTYLRSVIDESLRLYPPGWFFGRTARSDDNLNGVPITAGTTVLISAYLMHHHPRYWQNPDQFNPNRFQSPAAPMTPDPVPRFAYFPFGGGARLCIGNQFALLESTLALTQILQQFQLHFFDETVEKLASLTLRPKNDLWTSVC